MDKLSNRTIQKILIILLISSAAIRGFLAGFLELGNDEVYYWTYALYPDLSHFDHPPMVGWVIQIFTLDLLCDHEFFLRLASIVFGTLNTWIIFKIGAKLKDHLTGLYAAFLFTASIYCFLIAGTFILPDTPQLLFWLLSIYFFSIVFFSDASPYQTNLYLILAGVSIGLGMLSKYTSIYLWFGVITYLLLYERQWFKKGALYLALAISILCFLPVIFWNIDNDWISFTYQGGRANLFESGIKPDNFFRELMGQILYNNPFNVAIILIALWSVIRHKRNFSGKKTKFLLWISLPLILTFLFLSLFRGTLPHWSAPGYLGLIIIAAAFIADRVKQSQNEKVIPVWIQLSLSILLIVVILGAGQIKSGWLFYDYSEDPKNLGKNDVSLDMYGWKQLGERKLPFNLPIIAHRWFPAANLDYYVAYPNDTYVLAIGELSSIHKYAWINQARGGFYLGMDAIYISLSRDYKDPEELYSAYFREITPLDTLAIMRGKRKVQNVFVYHLQDLQLLPDPFH
ncbi:MAG: glycosyltransferase family 39 protein [Bacteroidota bacterium]|nr:glycosyltransferase family 39 protein [Bacteroidota bacterium]